MKALVVCLSSDLPHSTNRDSNAMYFVYDKQVLIDGQSLYSSTYSIVQEMPSEPAIDRFFIDLSDGLVKLKDDYTLYNYARVQTDAMLEVLRQAGTIHFFNSKQQYIDQQTRTLSVPFSDGAYQLVVDIPNDVLFNEYTILKFNPEIGAFDIYGETINFDPLETRGWHGHITDTIITKVEEGRIKAKLRISQSDKNIIKVLDDGIYAYPSNTISEEDFEAFKESYENYKTLLTYYIDHIEGIIEELEDILSGEVIDEKIHNALTEVIPTIDEAIANYDELADKLDNLYTYAKDYADAAFEEAITVMDRIIQEALSEPWGTLDSTPEPDPEPEPEEDPVEG